MEHFPPEAGTASAARGRHGGWWRGGGEGRRRRSERGEGKAGQGARGPAAAGAGDPRPSPRRPGRGGHVAHRVGRPQPRPGGDGAGMRSCPRRPRQAPRPGRAPDRGGRRRPAPALGRLRPAVPGHGEGRGRPRLRARRHHRRRARHGGPPHPSTARSALPAGRPDRGRFRAGVCRSRHRGEPPAGRAPEGRHVAAGPAVAGGGEGGCVPRRPADLPHVAGPGRRRGQGQAPEGDAGWQELGGRPLDSRRHRPIVGEGLHHSGGPIQEANVVLPRRTGGLCDGGRPVLDVCRARGGLLRGWRPLGGVHPGGAAGAANPAQRRDQGRFRAGPGRGRHRRLRRRLHGGGVVHGEERERRGLDPAVPRGAASAPACLLHGSRPDREAVGPGPLPPRADPEPGGVRPGPGRPLHPLRRGHQRLRPRTRAPSGRGDRDPPRRWVPGDGRRRLHRPPRHLPAAAGQRLRRPGQERPRDGSAGQGLAGIGDDHPGRRVRHRAGGDGGGRRHGRRRRQPAGGGGDGRAPVHHHLHHHHHGTRFRSDLPRGGQRPAGGPRRRVAGRDRRPGARQGHAGPARPGGRAPGARHRRRGVPRRRRRLRRAGRADARRGGPVGERPRGRPRAGCARRRLRRRLRRPRPAVQGVQHLGLSTAGRARRGQVGRGGGGRAGAAVGLDDAHRPHQPELRPRRPSGS